MNGFGKEAAAILLANVIRAACASFAHGTTYREQMNTVMMTSGDCRAGNDTEYSALRFPLLDHTRRRRLMMEGVRGIRLILRRRDSSNTARGRLD